MSVRVRKPRASTPATVVRSDEALLEGAQELFRARRLAAETEQRAESSAATVRARRVEAARRSRDWHAALRASVKRSILAERLHRRCLNRTEREVLAALVLSQLGLLPDQIHTCADLMALFRHSCRSTLTALRALAEEGRLVRFGLVVVDGEEADVPQREISVAPDLVEGLVLRGRQRATWCDVATEEELHERLDKLTRALSAKRESLAYDPFCHRSVSQATHAEHKVRRLLGDLHNALRQHPTWRLAALAEDWQSEGTWVMILALLGKWLGHLPADDPLFTGGGLARAAAPTADNVRYMIRFLMPNRPLVRDEVIRPCGADVEMATARPEALENVEFELTEATLRRLGLERRSRTAHQGEYQARRPRLRMEQLVFSPPVEEALAMALAHARLALHRAEAGPVTHADFSKALQMEQEGKWKSDGRSRIGFRR